MSNTENVIKKNEKPANEETENIVKPDVQVIGMPDEELLWERRFKRQCRG